MNKPPNFDPELWDVDELEIWRKQGYKCVVCGKWADTIHEIIPKSKTDDWAREGNQVLVCASCHNEIHRVGAKVWRAKLEVFRDKSLRLYR